MRLVLLLAALFTAAAAETPRFNEPVFVNDAGDSIDVGNYGAPLMYDWNGDGRKDLVCGQYAYGNIRFYPNLGPDSAPEFNGYELLEADDSVITLPYG